MKYLAISKDTKSLSYAVFNNKSLVKFDKILFTEYDEYKRTKEWYDFVTNLVKQHEIGILTTHWVDLKRFKKKELEKIISVKTILQLVAIEQKVVYLEAKTSGWEKYITNGKPTNRNKIKIVNEGYGLDLSINYLNVHKGQQDIADAIILCEAVAHGRIYV